MTGNPDLIQALQDLGLTPTEAEVYVATLGAAESSGPVSGYRVARDLGRDPANLAKVMAGLVRHGAVRIVQRKPRLYLPVSPDEFTSAVVRRVQERRFQALEMLRSAGPAAASGAPLLLADFTGAVEQAGTAIVAADAAVAVFASPAVLDGLAPRLAAAAARGCTVAVLASAPVAVPGAELAVVPDTGPAPGGDWLQLVCDERVWLAARSGATPAGCWGDLPAVAAVLAETMGMARRSGGVQAEAAALAAAAHGRVRPVSPAAPDRPEDPDGGDQGLTFIIRHDQQE